eukprot:4079892-Pyramimonas_sp.AAC.1
MISVPVTRLIKVHKFCWFTVFKSQEWRSGTIQDHQNAAIRLVRGVGIPRTMFWHAPGSLNSCRQTKQFAQ